MSDPIGGKNLLANPDVHHLPGDMGPAITGTPAKCFGWIIQLVDVVQHCQHATAIKLVALNQYFDCTHTSCPFPLMLPSLVYSSVTHPSEADLTFLIYL